MTGIMSSDLEFLIRISQHMGSVRNYSPKKGTLSAERVTGGGGDPAPARRPRDRLQTRGGDLAREEEEYRRR